MVPRILVAVDGSQDSLRAVEYVAKLLAGQRGVELTLYHAVALPWNAVEGGLEQERDRWMKEHRERVELGVFAPARQLLETHGVTQEVDLIRDKLDVDAHRDVALAIIDEARAGDYDTVVLGKRGQRRLKEFLVGSVTNKVVHHLRGCAIWVVE